MLPANLRVPAHDVLVLPGWGFDLQAEVPSLDAILEAEIRNS
jgi:hypothetical protein